MPGGYGGQSGEQHVSAPRRLLLMASGMLAGRQEGASLTAEADFGSQWCSITGARKYLVSLWGCWLPGTPQLGNSKPLRSCGTVQGAEQSTSFLPLVNICVMLQRQRVRSVPWHIQPRAMSCAAGLLLRFSGFHPP